MVGDFQEVQAPVHRAQRIEEVAIHVLLEIAGEEDALGADPDVQDERRVVHRSPGLGSGLGHAGGRRPDDLGVRLTDGERIATLEAHDRHAMTLGLLAVGGVAAAVAAHAVVDEDTDAVAREQPGEAADVVLVRVGQQGDIDAAVPDRDALIEAAHEQVGVATAIHEHPGAVVRLEQDRIALPDVEDGDAQDATRP
jgi:hypothetical protein